MGSEEVDIQDQLRGLTSAVYCHLCTAQFTSKGFCAGISVCWACFSLSVSFGSFCFFLRFSNLQRVGGAHPYYYWSYGEAGFFPPSKACGLTWTSHPCLEYWILGSICLGRQDQQASPQSISSQKLTVPPRASQQPVSTSLASFAKMVGSPPRVKQHASMAFPPAAKRWRWFHLWFPEWMARSGGSTLAIAVLEQSRASTIYRWASFNLEEIRCSMRKQVPQASRQVKGSSRQREIANRAFKQIWKLRLLWQWPKTQRRLMPSMKLPQDLATLPRGTSRWWPWKVEQLRWLSRDGAGSTSSMLHYMGWAFGPDYDGHRTECAGPEKYTGVCFCTFVPPRATLPLAYLREVDYIQNCRADLTKANPNPGASAAVAPTPEKKWKPKNKAQDAQAEWSRFERLESWKTSIVGRRMPMWLLWWGRCVLWMLDWWSSSKNLVVSLSTLLLLRDSDLRLPNGRVGSASTALFPIPVPDLRVWSLTRGRGGKKRRAQAIQKLLNLAVMALNFEYLRKPLSVLSLLRRPPSSPHHHRVYERL